MHQAMAYQARLNNTLKVVMIGPSAHPEGGTSIPFLILVDHMRACGMTVCVVPIPRGGKNILIKMLQFLVVLVQIVRFAPCSDVISAHVPTPQISNVGFAALIIARLFRRSFVLRQFSGMDPMELCLHRRLLARYVLKRSHLSFVEARRQRENVSRWLSTEVFWYPNQRSMPGRKPSGHCSRGRFVYIGRVRSEKGMGEILEAVKRLEGRCSVDIYGPCEQFDATRFGKAEHVQYRGVIDSRNVSAILTDYTALLLPTYWEGEGYPGVVIEAFQAGVPVIATRWKYLAEMVDETCGILVEPGDDVSLQRAMDRLTWDEEFAEWLRVGALARGEEFSAERWGNLFVRACCIASEDSDNKPRVRERMKELHLHSPESTLVPSVLAPHGEGKEHVLRKDR